MFYDNDAFDQDISSWNVSTVVSMEGMFNQSYYFDQDLSSFELNGIDFDKLTELDNKPMIEVGLKYHNEKPVIKELKRISKPSLRKYSSASDFETVKGGLGAYIISTNQGLMTDKDAKANNVGGEILCEVF